VEEPVSMYKVSLTSAQVTISSSFFIVPAVLVVIIIMEISCCHTHFVHGILLSATIISIFS
jgi:hypothetical protein